MCESKIENVVATANLGQHLDLDSILKVTSGAKYNPQQFPGFLYKLKKPKTSTLLFASGKMVCTGAVSARSAERAIARIITELRADGIVILKIPDVRIENIVATGDLGNRIDLENVAERLVKTIYEPEQFAGLIYRMDEPKVVFLPSPAENSSAQAPRLGPMSTSLSRSCERTFTPTNSCFDSPIVEGRILVSLLARALS